MRAPLAIFAMSVAAALAAPLAAHPKLVATSPAANSTAKPTAKIELRFSEKLVSQFTGADVNMTDMPGMKMSKPMKMRGKTAVGADGKTLVISFDQTLPEGAYTVAWHAVAADTHRIQGSFAFKVK